MCAETFRLIITKKANDLHPELQKVGETGEISLGVSDLWNAILIRAAEIMPFYSGSGTHLTGSQYSHSVYKLQCIIGKRVEIDDENL